MSPKKKKVLLIDDSDAARDLYGGWLKGAGYDVVEMDRGLGASAVLIKEQPDLVILDHSHARPQRRQAHECVITAQ